MIKNGNIESNRVGVRTTPSGFERYLNKGLKATYKIKLNIFLNQLTDLLPLPPLITSSISFSFSRNIPLSASSNFTLLKYVGSG